MQLQAATQVRHCVLVFEIQNQCRPLRVSLNVNHGQASILPQHQSAIQFANLTSVPSSLCPRKESKIKLKLKLSSNCCPTGDADEASTPTSTSRGSGRSTGAAAAAAKTPKRARGSTAASRGKKGSSGSDDDDSYRAENDEAGNSSDDSGGKFGAWGLQFRFWVCVLVVCVVLSPSIQKL